MDDNLNEVVSQYCYVCGIEQAKENRKCENCGKRDTLCEITRQQKTEIIQQMYADFIKSDIKLLEYF